MALLTIASSTLLLSFTYPADGRQAINLGHNRNTSSFFSVCNYEILNAAWSHSLLERCYWGDKDAIASKNTAS